jgi:nucleotide-binding universal stress UspA family protein
MKLQGPILVGTDFSAASDEALRQGNVLADDLGTNLIVCHVVPELDAVNILFPQLAARNAEHREILTSKARAGV